MSKNCMILFPILVKGVEFLKKFVGGDPLFIDRKHLHLIILNPNTLKLIIGTNYPLPRFEKIDNAFADRMYIYATSVGPFVDSPCELNSCFPM